MHIQYLDIFGFKSFADKTKIKFSNGITTIVGPNGSGKSNIVDSVRWVLGEQSIKSLRGHKMEEVIFLGSIDRKPLGFSEVSLTFNEFESNDVPYSEVKITRRLYRSGESEYLINNRNCRLKDIHELLMDTGSGKDAYSIISQGQIEDILSDKGEDRRRVFEEVAGIVKYKTRRAESQKKLDITDNNISRIRDLLFELNGQEKVLQNQSQVAKKYLQYKEELKKTDIGLYIHNIEYLDHQVIESKQKDKELSVNQTILEANINNNDNNFDEIKKKQIFLDTENNRFQKELLSLTKNIEYLIGEKKLEEEKILSNNQLKNEFNNSIKDYKTQIENILVEQKNLNIKINKQTNFIKDKENKLTEVNNELDSLSFGAESENLSLQIDQKKKKLFEQESIINNINFKIEDLKKDLANCEREHDVHINKLTSYNEEINRLLISKKELISLCSVKENKLNNNQVELKSINQKLNNLIASKKIAEEKQSKLSLEFNWLKNNENIYFKSVNEVLKIKSSDLYGTVAQIFKVEDKFQLAIETALGNVLQNLVVQDEQAAQKYINYLKTNKLGRATFFPVNLIKPKEMSKSDLLKCSNLEGFIGVASTLVNNEPKYNSLLANLLGLVLVSKNISLATTLAKQISFRYKIVTLDGDIINSGGSMSGGSINKNKSSLLATTQKIADLKIAINSVEEEIQKHSYDISDLDNEKSKLLKDSEDLASNITKLENEIKDKSLALEKINLHLHHSEAELSKIKIKKEQKSEEFSKLDLNHENEIKLKLSKDLNLLIDQLKKSKSDTEKDSNQKNHLNDILTNLKIEIAKSEKDIEGFRIAAETNAQNITALNNKILILQTKIEQLNIKVIPQSADIFKLEQEKKELTNKIEKIATEKNELISEAAEISKEIKNSRKKLEDIKINRNTLLIQTSNLEESLDNNLKTLAEEYEISYERAAKEYEKIIDPNAAKNIIDDFKKSISDLGPINLTSIEEYDKLIERLEYIKTQENDLSTAKNRLIEIIDNLEKDIVKNFDKSFAEVRIQFQKVFKEIFSGGEADISYSDPEDLLSTGIEIIAQPPGKKTQNLSLLSGGERALTAIALLFAILKVKPAPFCILDEVDASLDEANLFYFMNFLKTYSEKTQFIIITHRKATMQFSNILYGVTMQNSGVSKIMSLKLDENSDQENNHELAATII